MIALIIEDDPVVRGLWVRFLTPVAAEIRHSDNLEEAIELMRRIPPPDLVLLDLRLPDSTKAEATLARIPEFKRMNPKAVIMVITGAMDSNLPSLATQSGVDAFIDKGSVTGQTKLLQSIQEACAGSTIEERMAIIHKLSEFMTAATVVIEEEKIQSGIRSSPFFVANRAQAS